MGAPAEGVRRAEIDDAAAPAAAHRRDGVLAEEERAAQVGGHDLVPQVGRGLFQGGAGEDAGVVDQDVEAPEVRDGGRDDGRRSPPRGSRRWPGSGPAPPAATIRRTVSSPACRTAVGDDDGGALAGEGHGDPPADAAAGAGDDGDLAGQAPRSRRLGAPRSCPPAAIVTGDLAQGRTTVPSRRRTGGQAPLRGCSGKGYFAASASSTSMPRPGLSFDQNEPSRISGQPGKTSRVRSLKTVLLLDAEVVAGQVEVQVGGVADRRDVARAVPGRAHAEELAEGRQLARRA